MKTEGGKDWKATLRAGEVRDTDLALSPCVSGCCCCLSESSASRKDKRPGTRAARHGSSAGAEVLLHRERTEQAEETMLFNLMVQ